MRKRILYNSGLFCFSDVLDGFWSWKWTKIIAKSMEKRLKKSFQKWVEAINPKVDAIFDTVMNYCSTQNHFEMELKIDLELRFHDLEWWAPMLEHFAVWKVSRLSLNTLGLSGAPSCSQHESREGTAGSLELPWPSKMSSFLQRFSMFFLVKNALIFNWVLESILASKSCQNESKNH